MSIVSISEVHNEIYNHISEILEPFKEKPYLKWLLERLIYDDMAVDKELRQEVYEYAKERIEFADDEHNVPKEQTNRILMWMEHYLDIE